MVLLGCSSLQEYPEFRDKAVRNKIQSLYNSYVSFNDEQSRVFPVVNSDVYVFDTEKEQFVNSNDRQNMDYTAPNKIVFFQLSDKNRTSLYFDPVSGKLRPLPETRDGKVYITRSLADKTSNPFDTTYLNLYQYSFSIADGEPEFDAVSQLTDGDYNDHLPASFGTEILFLRFHDDKPSVLMGLNDEGGVYEIEGMQDMTPLTLRELDEHSVVIEARHDGESRFYSYSTTSRVLTEVTGFDREYYDTERFFLINGSDRSNQLPVVCSIPEEIVPESLIDFVKYRNPKVNRRRADFVASLIKAEIVRLNKYPSISFALYYTPEVGVFGSEPEEVTGDFLSEGIARGVVGLVQDVAGYKRNDARHRAAVQRSEMMRYYMEDEINDQTADALSIYKEIEYYRTLLNLNERLVANTYAKQRYYEHHLKKDNALEVNLMSAVKNRTSFQSMISFYKDRLEYLHKRLWKLCGIHLDLAPGIQSDRFNYTRYREGMTDTFINFARANHPKIKVIDYALNENFFIMEQGADNAPSLSAGAYYAQSRDQFSTFVDDYISLSVTGAVPVMWNQISKLHEGLRNASFDSLKFQRQDIIDEIGSDAEEALMSYKAALRDYNVKKQDCDYWAEKYRLTSLYLQLGSADTAVKVPEADRMIAFNDYLQSRVRMAGSEFEVESRYVTLMRQLGVAERSFAKPIDNTKKEPQRDFSVWAWKTDEIIFSEGETSTFLQTAGLFKINRVYLYVEPNLLKEERSTQHLTRFIDRCARKNINVWALLAEPEWLYDPSSHSNLKLVIDRIHDYNQKDRKGILPRFKGIKLDIEPHADPQWDNNRQERIRLTNLFRSTLKTVWKSNRKRLPILLDLPYKFFKGEDDSLLDFAQEFSNGLTVMCYSRSPQTVYKMARKASTYPLMDFEVGIEFNTNASETDTLAGSSKADIDLLVKNLFELKNTGRVQSISYHDYTGLKQNQTSREEGK